MSHILSPYPPLKINITIDPKTGVVNCDIPSPLPVPLVIETFASLISKYVKQMVVQGKQPPSGPTALDPVHDFLATTNNAVICQICGGHQGNHLTGTGKYGQT